MLLPMRSMRWRSVCVRSPKRFAADAADIAVLVAEHARPRRRSPRAIAETGAARLWRGEAGMRRRNSSRRCRRTSEACPPIEPASFAPLIRTLMEERRVRPAYGRHPRLAILGPLEARLQAFDVMVLGGLNEGTWPAPPPPIRGCRVPCAQRWDWHRPNARIGLGGA